MKGVKRMPTDFELFDNHVFLWDEHHNLNESVRDAIYMNPLYSHLLYDLELYARIWWSDDTGHWCGELFEDELYTVTFICDTPEQIKEEVEAHFRERFL